MSQPEYAQWDLEKSGRRFVNTVYPAIEHDWFDSARLEPQEDGDPDNDLDIIGGVDYWLIDGRESMFSLASRVQAYPNQSTFTVRFERESPSGVVRRNTEYQKRTRSIEEGSQYPDFTLQAYVPRYNYLSNAAYCRTEDLYEYLRNGVLYDDFDHNKVEDGDGSIQRFYTVHWQDMGRFYDVHIFDPENLNDKWRLSDQDDEGQSFLAEFGGDD